MAVNIQLRNGISTQWTSVNPTLMIGEIGVETDTSQFKIGNGISTWNTLPYATSSFAYSSSFSILSQTASLSYTSSTSIISQTASIAYTSSTSILSQTASIATLSSASISSDTSSYLAPTNNYTVSNIVVSGSLSYPNASSSNQSSVLTVDQTGSVRKRTFINVITKSIAFNLTSSEEGHYIRYTGASDANLTILSSSVHPMDINSIFTVMQAGAGIVTVTGSAATIVVNGANKTGGQYKAVQIVKVDTDTFDVIGGVL